MQRDIQRRGWKRGKYEVLENSDSNGRFSLGACHGQVIAGRERANDASLARSPDRATQPCPTLSSRSESEFGTGTLPQPLPAMEGSWCALTVAGCPLTIYGHERSDCPAAVSHQLRIASSAAFVYRCAGPGLGRG